MSEPLKGKNIECYDMVGVHPCNTRYVKGGRLFIDDDIKSAVEWLKEEIYNQSEIYPSLNMVALNTAKIKNLINKAFEDVILNDRKEGEKK